MSSSMKVWEIANWAEPITILTDDFFNACVAAFILGEGKYGIIDDQGDYLMPPFLLASRNDIVRWFKANFPDDPRTIALPTGAAGLNQLLENYDKFAVARVLRTAQVCNISEREAYQKALELMEPEKQQQYAEWWKERRRTAMNDIVAYAWHLAENLEQKGRELNNG